MKHALVAGSFDPITNGHVWLIKQALKLADRVTVVVGVNPSKKYMFDMDERIDLVGEVITNELVNFEEVRRIDVVPLQGELLVNYAKLIDADVLVRGIRNTTDFSYESEILLINRNIQPTIDTVYVVPPRELTEVSSSTVKGLVGFNGWEGSIRNYVDPIVIQALAEKIPPKKVIESPLIDPTDRTADDLLSQLRRRRSDACDSDDDDLLSRVRCHRSDAPASNDDGSSILAEIKRRRAELAVEKPVEITAASQLNSWTDGPKIVLDFHGLIPVNVDKYTHIAISDWQREERNVLSFINAMPAATIFVAGHVFQVDAVRAAAWRHTVVQLGRWLSAL